MLIQSKMVTFLVIVFFGCRVVATESDNCVRVQFSIDDENGINTNQNFTKQSFVKNEQPVYYSYSRTADSKFIQTIIWRDNESWLSQERHSSGNMITKTKI